MPDFIDKLKDTITRSRSRNRDPLEEGATTKHHSHLNPEFSDVPEEGEHGGRGRSYVASGRGGAGNMSHSRGRQPNPNQPDEDAAVVDKARSNSRSRSKDVYAGGRGGAGNIRSPSRDPAARAKADALNAEEREITKKWEEEHKDDKLSAGRGGMGNVGKVTLHDAVAASRDEGITED